MDIKTLQHLLDRCDDCPDGTTGQCLNESCPYHQEFIQLINHGSVEIEDDCVSFIQKKGGYNGSW